MIRLSAKAKWLVSALVGLVVVGVIVGALLTSRRDVPSSSPDGRSTEASEAAESSGTIPSAAEVTASGAPGGYTDESDANAETGANPSKPTVSTPPATGAALVTITVPPARTLAMISPDNASADVTYTVEFRPYGAGPTRGSIETLVISVTSSKPSAATGELVYEFKNRNVLVNLSPQAAQAIGKGGTYRGTLTLRKSGDVLIPWLDDVGAAS